MLPFVNYKLEFLFLLMPALLMVFTGIQHVKGTSSNQDNTTGTTTVDTSTPTSIDSNSNSSMDVTSYLSPTPTLVSNNGFTNKTTTPTFTSDGKPFNNNTSTATPKLTSTGSSITEIPEAIDTSTIISLVPSSTLTLIPSPSNSMLLESSFSDVMSSDQTIYSVSPSAAVSSDILSLESTTILPTTISAHVTQSQTIQSSVTPHSPSSTVEITEKPSTISNRTQSSTLTVGEQVATGICVPLLIIAILGITLFFYRRKQKDQTVKFTMPTNESTWAYSNATFSDETAPAMDGKKVQRSS